MSHTHPSLWQSVEAVRATSPLVHNITNYVVMQTVANALLAAGASPVMAHALEEVEEIAGIASSLSLNIGTLSPAWVEAMKLAITVAAARGIPIVLDPVGAGASLLRTRVSLDLLERIPQPILRGNASEILALAGEARNTRGVDSVAESTVAEHAALLLAARYGGTVCVSGEEDIIVQGQVVRRLLGGSPLMPRVTGMGCTASALMAAFAAVHSPEGTSQAALGAMALMAAAGGLAASHAAGPGTFLPHFIDALANCTYEDFYRRVSFVGPDD